MRSSARTTPAPPPPHHRHQTRTPRHAPDTHHQHAYALASGPIHSPASVVSTGCGVLSCLLACAVDGLVRVHVHVLLHQRRRRRRPTLLHHASEQRTATHPLSQTRRRHDTSMTLVAWHWPANHSRLDVRPHLCRRGERPSRIALHRRQGTGRASAYTTLTARLWTSPDRLTADCLLYFLRPPPPGSTWPNLSCGSSAVRSWSEGGTDSGPHITTSGQRVSTQMPSRWLGVAGRELVRTENGDLVVQHVVPRQRLTDRLAADLTHLAPALLQLLHRARLQQLPDLISRRLLVIACADSSAALRPTESQAVMPTSLPGSG